MESMLCEWMAEYHTIHGHICIVISRKSCILISQTDTDISSTVSEFTPEVLTAPHSWPVGSTLLLRTTRTPRPAVHRRHRSAKQRAPGMQAHKHTSTHASTMGHPVLAAECKLWHRWRGVHTHVMLRTAIVSGCELKPFV